MPENDSLGPVEIPRDRLERMILGTDDGFWEWPDMSADRLWWSPRLFEMIGYQPNEMEPNLQSYLQMIHPEDIGLIRDQYIDLSTINPEPIRLEYRLKTKSGSYIWVQAHGQVFKGENGVLTMSGSLRDITSRIRTERKLRRNEELLQETGKTAKVGGWELVLKSSKIFWTEEVFRIHEIEADCGPSLDASLKYYPEEDGKQLSDAIQHAAEEHEPFDLELEFTTARGNHRWVRVIGKPVVTNGQCDRVHGTIQDISDRKKTEIQLRESEDLHRSILASISDSVFLTDLNGTLVFVCPNVDVTFGFSVEEAEAFSSIDQLLGSGLFDMEDLIRAGSISNIEHSVRDKEGNSHTLLTTVSLVTIGAGEILYVCRDITERRAMEKELRSSEASMAAILGNTDDIIFSFDHDYRLVSANPSFQKHLESTGLFRAQIGDNLLFDNATEKTKRKWKSIFDRALQGESFAMEMESEYLSETRIYESHFSPIRTSDGKIQGASVVSRDVTAYKRLVREKELAAQRLELALRGSGIGMYDWNPQTGEMYFSPEWKLQIGYAEDEFEESIEHWEAHLHPDDKPRIQQHLEDVLAGKSGDYTFEYRLRHKNGGYRWILSRGDIIRDDQGKPIRMSGCHVDITDRSRIIEELERSRSLLDQAEQLANIGGWELDLSARKVRVSENWRRIHGVLKSEIALEELMPIAHPDDRERLGKALEASIRHGEPYNQQHRIIRQDNGEVRIVRATGRVVCDAEGNPIRMYGVGTDETEKVLRDREKLRLEDQLRQAQKMEVVGHLAGGIAHDFNNNLQAMMGYAELLKGMLDPQTPEAEFLEEMIRGAERATDLTRQLLAFSRRQILEPKPISLSDIVRNLTSMIGRVLGGAIEFNLKFSMNDPVIHADPGQIEQTLINLCINARDAMPNGGQLTIGMDRATLDNEFCENNAWAEPGVYGCLTVTDTGAGMDEMTLGQIFEPFFTTKEVGKGTGLGLSTVYGIVKQHDGLIHATSEPDRGTTFQLYFPVAESMEGMAIPAQEAGGSGHGKTILLAEDDNTVRRLTVRILMDAGYRVLSAANGEEAIESIQKHGDELDLALLDVVMPRMSGKEVYDYLKCNRPETPILLMSGYSQGTIDSEYANQDPVNFIQKPFAPSDLLRRIEKSTEML